MDDRRSRFIPSILRGSTETIDNISGLAVHVKVYGDEFKDNNRPMMLRPEQNCETLLKMLVNKYTRNGDLLFDAFGASYSSG